MTGYIEDIRQGNHKSFEIVFKLWHKKVFAYFFNKTASDDLAEELTQLAFIKLWRFKHTLSDDYPIDIQLFKISKSTLLDYFKKVATEDRNLYLYKLETETNTIEQSLHFDTKRQLDEVLNCLPPVRKQVFVLSRLQGYSYKEIAEQLSISPRTVEKHISLAIKQLDGYAYLPAFILLLIFFS